MLVERKLAALELPATIASRECQYHDQRAQLTSNKGNVLPDDGKGFELEACAVPEPGVPTPSPETHIRMRM
jgi:hypothetical protein